MHILMNILMNNVYFEEKHVEYLILSVSKILFYF